MNANENNVLEAMSRRRSVRRFDSRNIEENVLIEILEAATHAPNAHNRQTWRFVVLDDLTARAKLVDVMSKDYRAALLAEGIAPDKVEARVSSRGERVNLAPKAVMICVDMDELDEYDNALRQDGEYLMAVQSAAMAGDHLLLAAHAVGLSGVWMCAPLFVQQKVRETFDLPETWLAQGLVLLGYPAEECPKKPRKELGQVVVYK